MASDDLEIWDQIKSRVDTPYMSTRDDEIDVARIAADLKRSAEFELPQQPSASNGTDFHPHTSESRSNVTSTVERAEADSTFLDDNEEIGT